MAVDGGEKYSMIVMSPWQTIAWILVSVIVFSIHHCNLLSRVVLLIMGMSAKKIMGGGDRIYRHYFRSMVWFQPLASTFAGSGGGNGRSNNITLEF